jgi:hypothetical protein
MDKVTFWAAMDELDPDEYEAQSRADGTWPDAALDEFAELCRESD